MREIDPLPKSRRPLVVAHRGASIDAPENTLPAFELAWKQGAGAIEGDFRLTADGEVVCIHDPTTKRIWGGGLQVATSTLKELKKLKIGKFGGKE
jgi:glycerophosphoryl diester phosphodiesterase